MKTRTPAPRGFTLVEIVITLAIIGLLISLALGSMSGLTHQRELQEPMFKLQEFAKKARNLAIFEQRPYSLEIIPNGVALYSMVAATGNGASTPDGMKARSMVDSYTWDSGAVLSVRRWNAREFAPGRQIWVFERSGLCEPLTARIESENGFIEMTFNALDAHVEDTTSEIQ